MQVATLKKKSVGLNKGKLKKTIKNVLCRPDSIHWPVISEENGKDLSMSLNSYKVEIPKFKKLKWEILKKIPKEERPKPPPMKKPDGLIFGLRHCSEAIGNKECSAVLIDSEVNPRSIAQPLIEVCINSYVPVVCMKHLKELSVSNYGIKSACLGIKEGYLEEVAIKVSELAKRYVPQQLKTKQSEECNVKTLQSDSERDRRTSEEINDTKITNYLLTRSSKKSRVFVPPSDHVTVTKEVNKKFIGQDFIKFSGETNKKENTKDLNTKHTYRNMKLKRIASNPNRVQMGKNRKTENAKS